jgi:hypothetical protein
MFYCKENEYIIQYMVSELNILLQTSKIMVW